MHAGLVSVRFVVSRDCMTHGLPGLPHTYSTQRVNGQQCPNNISVLCVLLGRGLVSVYVFLCLYLSLVFTISSVFKSLLDYLFSISLSLVASVFSLVFFEDESVLLSVWKCSYGNSQAVPQFQKSQTTQKIWDLNKVLGF